ncbi:claudin-17-like [Salarias fasciatus]|uniref:Claudin n=1 Tax=Salarias fasciatus TaxID=181472 RepID=A0A672FZ89_SALFA|nr:claudin-17-like [Salarias fasciatus]
MRAKLEVLALVLGSVGLMGTVAIAALPTWRVSAFIGANLIVMEELWEGLWMTCYRQIDVNMQCKAYDSLLALPPELRAARALTCVSIALVVVSLLVTGCGTQKSICCSDDVRMKNVALALGGSLFLLSSLATLIPVSWVAHTVVRNFYNPAVVDAQKRELGDALFIGWATSALLLITGVILLFQYSKRTSKEQVFTGEHLMTEKDVKKEDSIYLPRTASSFHKIQEYV